MTKEAIVDMEQDKIDSIKDVDSKDGIKDVDSKDGIKDIDSKDGIFDAITNDEENDGSDTKDPDTKIPLPHHVACVWMM